MKEHEIRRLQDKLNKRFIKREVKVKSYKRGKIDASKIHIERPDDDA